MALELYLDEASTTTTMVGQFHQPFGAKQKCKGTWHLE